jgi:hypothetical protein
LVDSGLIPVTVTLPESATHQPLGEVSVFDNGVEATIRHRMSGSAPVALTVLVHLNRRHAAAWYQATEEVLRMLPRVSVEGRAIVTVNIARNAAGAAFAPVANVQAPDAPWVPVVRNFWHSADWALARTTFRMSRRVMLLVTDGDHRDFHDWNDDVSDTIGGADVVRRIREEHALLYVVRLGPGSIPKELRSAAAESGGAVRDIEGIDQLRRVLQDIVSELAAQVLLYVSPAVADGRLHRLAVRSATPDLVLRSRQAYQSFAGR